MFENANNWSIISSSIHVRVEKLLEDYIVFIDNQIRVT